MYKNFSVVKKERYCITSRSLICDTMPSRAVAKVCRDVGLEDEGMIQWTRTVIGKIWDAVLEDVEAREAS